MTSDLFHKIKDFRFVRINNIDAKKRTDDFLTLRRSLLDCDEMYPGIKKWIDKKVIDGLIYGQRNAYIGYLNDKPVVSAVIKKGKKSKFCHLKISENIQEINLGEIFFIMMTLEVRNIAGKINFTLPEGLWETKKEFFKSFGFTNHVKAYNQYRLFEDEFYCEANFQDVFLNVQTKLPKLIDNLTLAGNPLDSSLVMSIHPEHIDKILTGEKTVELRKRFSKKWEGKRINLYATSPFKALVGCARIKKVVHTTKESVWKFFEHLIGCTKNEYDEYTNDADHIYAILLDDISPFNTPIPIEQLSYLLGDNHIIPPQSYLKLSNNNHWSSAVTLAALLDGSISKKI